MAKVIAQTGTPDSLPETTVIGYEVRPQQAVQMVSCGDMMLTGPVPQIRRTKPFFIAYLVLKGELYLTDELPDGAESFTIKPGEIHVLGPDIPQKSWRPSHPGTRLLWTHFSFFEDPVVRHLTPRDFAGAVIPAADGTSGQLWRIPRQLRLGTDTDGMAQLHAELLSYQRLYGSGDMGCHSICGHFITRLQALFLQSRLGRSQPSSQQLQVERARDYIHRHYHRPISLAEVAAAVRLSPAYLSRCFRRVMDQTLVDYLLRIRVQAAKEMLAGESMPSVKEVAFQSGFSSSIYFCRVFRRIEGQTATQFAATAKVKTR